MIEILKSLFSENPKIVILGFGKEGRSTYLTIRKYFPDIEITIADVNEKLGEENLIQGDTNLNLRVGSDYLVHLSDFDLIIKSPGVKIETCDKELISKITSQTDLFLQCYANQVIGVTGTKGKSTTVSLIKHFLDAANKQAVLLGNIGVPAFDKIDKIDKNSIIVYELSAHQLEYIHVSPRIAVLLNIFPEHLDYFNNYDEYRQAKFNVFNYQTEGDKLIINQSIISLLPKLEQEVVSINSDNNFCIKNSPLLGKHNLTNINSALFAVKEFGVTIEDAISSLGTFRSLPHRLEYVGDFAGVKFINDSISTIPESTIAAVTALEKVDTIILGGWDRGLDYKGLVLFLQDSNISKFIFLGKAGDRIFDLFNSDFEKELTKAQSMIEVFEIISKNSNIGDICLLSPAAASYDQFHNFEHRGDTFKKLARERSLE